jgi:hypothetical protein
LLLWSRGEVPSGFDPTCASYYDKPRRDALERLGYLSVTASGQMSASFPTIEIKPATLFTRKAILIGSLYGLVLVIPVVVSMMLVTVLQFGVVTFLLPWQPSPQSLPFCLWDLETLTLPGWWRAYRWAPQPIATPSSFN